MVEHKGTTDWNKEARRVLRFEMQKRGLRYKELLSRLERLGVEETERSIISKVSRGTFSMAFFLQCMSAMDAKTVRLKDDDH